MPKDKPQLQLLNVFIDTAPTDTHQALNHGIDPRPWPSFVLSYIGGTSSHVVASCFQQCVCVCISTWIGSNKNDKSSLDCPSNHPSCRSHVWPEWHSSLRAHWPPWILCSNVSQCHVSLSMRWGFSKTPSTHQGPRTACHNMRWSSHGNRSSRRHDKPWWSGASLVWRGQTISKHSQGPPWVASLHQVHPTSRRHLWHLEHKNLVSFAPWPWSMFSCTKTQLLKPRNLVTLSIMPYLLKYLKVTTLFWMLGDAMSLHQSSTIMSSSKVSIFGGLSSEQVVANKHLTCLQHNYIVRGMWSLLDQFFDEAIYFNIRIPIAANFNKMLMGSQVNANTGVVMLAWDILYLSSTSGKTRTTLHTLQTIVVYLGGPWPTTNACKVHPQNHVSFTSKMRFSWAR